MPSPAAPRLLRHVVLFAFKPGSTPDDIAAIERAFAALPAQIPAIVDFEWGTDVSIEGKADGFTHCFFVSFADEAGRDAYLPHPAHKAFVELALPHKARSLVIDYWARSG